jgi:hypothetical protein
MWKLSSQKYKLRTKAKMESHSMRFCAMIVLKRIINKIRNMIRDSLQNMDKEFYLLRETYKFEILFQEIYKILY